MTEFKTDYLSMNVDEKERTEEVRKNIETNLKEREEERTGSRTLENKYREFLYFMARYEATHADKQAVTLIKGEILEHDRNEMNREQEHRQKIKLAQQSQEELGRAIEERYKKIIMFRDIELPDYKTLGGNLDAQNGLPLRAKYFGKGVSNKLIKTWDQLLYAFNVANPQMRELDKMDNPVNLTGGEVVTTAPFYDALGLRTDTAEGINTILENFKPTTAI